MSQPYPVYPTYIITLDNACEVKLGKVTLRQRRLQSTEASFRSTPTIHLPGIIAPEGVKLRKVINLDNIDLESLQFLSHTLQDNSAVIHTSESQLVNVHSVSIGTIVLYFIFRIKYHFVS